MSGNERQPVLTRSRPSTRGAASLASALALVLLAVGAVWWWQRRLEANVDPTRVPLAAYDDYVYYQATFRYAADELRAGRFPHWNPYQHAGSPFFATAENIVLYPPNALYLFLSSSTAEKLAAILHLTLAGFGTVLLARAWRLSWPAAATSGIGFTFAPHVTSLVFLPHHLYGVAWIPWQLLMLHRLLAAAAPWPWAALLGICVALQYLGGYPMYCLMSTYMLAAYFLWWHWGAMRAGESWRALLASGLAVTAAALLAISLSLPKLLPGLELARQSLRSFSALSLEQAAMNSVPPLQSLLRVVLPMHDVDLLLPGVYAGIPLLLLAGLGAVSPWRATGAGFLLGMTVISWMLAWGTHTPLFRLFYELFPGGGAFRGTNRFFPLTSLGIAMLGGIGVDTLWRARRGPAFLRRVEWVLIGLGVALLLVSWAVPLPDRIEPPVTLPAAFPIFMSPGERPAALVAALGGYLIAAAAWFLCYRRASRGLRRVLVATLPAVVYATLFVATRNTQPFPVTHPDFLAMPKGAVAFLRAAQGVDRTYVAQNFWPFGPRPPAPPRAGILYGLYDLTDRENLYPKRFADLVALMYPPQLKRTIAQLQERFSGWEYIEQGEVVVTGDSPNLRLLDLLGVRFIVEGAATFFGAEHAPDRFVRVYDADGIRIFRNVEAFPRAFVVHRAEIVTDPGRALERLTDPDFDPSSTALLEREPPLPLPGEQVEPAGTARIVRYMPDEVVIDVDMPRAGLLLLTDQYYPGWESEVDGNSAEILAADHAFRGVALEAGTHRVVFRFVPRSFRHGLLLGALGTVVALGGLAATQRSMADARRSGARAGQRAGGMEKTPTDGRYA